MHLWYFYFTSTSRKIVTPFTDQFQAGVNILQNQGKLFPVFKRDSQHYFKAVSTDDTAGGTVIICNNIIHFHYEEGSFLLFGGLVTKLHPHPHSPSLGSLSPTVAVLGNVLSVKAA